MSTLTEKCQWYAETMANYAAEYRLHCSKNGCFMAWRKLRKADTPEDRRWYFNSDHCNWVGEDHELFNKPTNWDKMCIDSTNAILSTGLEIGCVDLRCQSPKKQDPLYKIIEVNSAPALSEKGLNAYRVELARLISEKIESYGK